MTVRIAIDTGGTFTDLVLFDVDTGDLFFHKVGSTPDDPGRALVRGIAEVIDKAGASGQAIELLVHGTTVATNAVLERKGAATGLITTVAGRGDAAHGLGGHVIADGGCTCPGDVAKAFAAGADFVMLGSMLAGTDESPGEKVVTLGGVKKEYRGMASKDAQIKWRGRYSSNEGISTFIPYKGSVKTILEDLRNGIVSGFSYSGARSVVELQTKAKFIKQTNAGLGESRTHILGKT